MPDTINIKGMLTLLLLFNLPVSSIACELTFNGQLFLQSYYAKGISPRHNCLEVSVNENKFYAFPDKICELKFDQSTWLNNDWNFKSIQGLGTFSVNINQQGLTVVINKGGGFRLRACFS